jgi:hypothetical protein
MVEKIDRPESRPIYEIREPKHTKEDQHHQHNPREDAEKELRKRLAEDQKEWNKFGSRNITIKPTVVIVDRIAKIIFRSITLFKGIGVMHADIIWKDGRKTLGILLRVPRMEDFIRFKKLAPGSEVPADFWTLSDKLEIGVIQTVATSGSFQVGERQEKAQKKTTVNRDWAGILVAMGIVNKASRKINWGIALFYAFLIAVLSIALITK